MSALRFSLRTKILLVLLTVIIAITAIGSLLVNSRIQAGATREAAMQASAAAAQTRAIHNERAATLVAEGEAVSLYPAVIAALVDSNSVPLQTWATEVAKRQGTLVTVTDASGTVIARGNAPSSRENLAPQLAGLRLALAGEKASGVEGGDDLGLALRGYAPVFSNGRIVGAVMIADALDDRYLTRLTGAAAAEDRASISETVIDDGCRAASGSRNVCSISLPSPEGTAAATLQLEVPLAEIDAARSESQRALLVTGAVVLVAGSGLAYVFALSLTRPLKRLTDSAESIAQGRYDEPLALAPSGDEVGALAGAFETMRRQVHASTTALQDQRDVLDSVVEAVDAGILLTDSTGRQLLANRRWQTLLGAPALQNGDKLARHGGAPGTFADLAASWLTGSDTMQTDFEDFSGAYRRFRAYTAPVGAGSPPPARIFVLRDVTVETEAERTRSAFVAMVSHELRSPLTAVKGYTQTLLEAGPWDEATEREFLEIVAASADRLGDLIDNLLDAAQVEAGVLRLNPEPARIERLVDTVVKQLAGRLASHSVAVNMDPDLPLVHADPVRVEQVLTNLIENAAKYSPAGGAITVRVRDEAMLTISVTDQGIGISKEDQEHVFERFFRVAPKAGGGPKGVGLGLFICRSLVEAQGGRMWVESRPGEGSTFSFTLPRLEETEPADTDVAAPEEAAATVGGAV